MTAPVLDAIATESTEAHEATGTTAPGVTPEASARADAEARSADLFTFKVGMSAIAVVVLVMACVGIVASSAVLLVAAVIVATAGVVTGIFTGVRLLA